MNGSSPSFSAFRMGGYARLFIFFAALLVVFATYEVVNVTANKLSKQPPKKTSNNSYFKPSHINSGGTSARIYLSEPKPLAVTHKGAKAAVEALASNSAQPLSLAAADLDADGVQDLVVGYGTKMSGVIAIHRGNLDAFAPQSQPSFEAIGRGEFPSPFLPEAKTFSIPIRPDFMAIGHFTAGASLDLIAASKTSNTIYVLPGDDKGNFGNAQITQLPGEVTALAATSVDSGVPAACLVIGVADQKSSSLITYRETANGLAFSGSYLLAAPATTINVGDLDRAIRSDAAIVAGGQVLILHGDTAQLEPLQLPLEVESLTLGSFLFDRNGGTQMALLSSDGSISIAAHASFDARALTDDEASNLRRSALGERRNSSVSMERAARDQTWRVVETIPGAVFAGDSSQPTLLMRTRVSSNGADDVMALSPTSGEMMVLSHSDEKAGDATFNPGQISSLPYSSSPIAALPVRVNIDGRPGLVTLNQNRTAPSVLAPEAVNTYTVTGTADTNPIPACTGVSPNISCPTLRGAVLAANANAGTDTIMIPMGTYTLSLAKVNGDFTGNHGALYINDSVNIVGSVDGSGNPNAIIQAGTIAYNAGVPNGVDMVMAVNQDISSFTTATASISNVMIQNGHNRGTVGGTDGDGGCMEFDTGLNGTANLTLTNVTIQNCDTTDGNGGGLANFNTNNSNGLATISNSIIQNNSAKQITGGNTGTGGGIWVADPSRISLSRSQVKNNLSTNSGGANAGSGGGITITSNSTGSRQTVIHGTTISGNQTAGLGGGLNITANTLIDQGSIISNNSAGTANIANTTNGGGIWMNTGNPDLVTLSKVTITGNSAANGNGGGISVGSPGGTHGTLNMSLSRLAGNTSVAGSNLNNIAGTVTATNNWWGTNAPATTINNTTTTATFDPFIVLSNTASPNLICVAASTTLTASFLQDNHGTPIAASNLDVLAGLPITFNNPVHGTLSNAQPQIGIKVNISTAVEASSTVTITTSTPHGFSAGQTVTISGVTNTGYNGVFAIATTPTTTTFTYTNSLTSLTASSGGTASVPSGTATATFTANAGGAASADAVVDNGTATAAITVPTSFTSVASTSWTTATTWTPQCVPQPTDTAIIASPTTVTLPATQTIGNITINSGGTLSNGVFDLNVGGNVTNNGSFSGTGALNFNGNNNTQTWTNSGTGLNYGSVTINHTGTGGVSLGASSGPTISTLLTLTNGALSIGANTLTINGGITTTSGTLTGGTTSNLTFGGAGASTTLPTVANGLGNLTINRANGITLGGNLTVNGTLALTSGAFAIGSNTLTLNGGTSASGGSLTSNANGTVNYNQSSNGQAVLGANYGNLTFSNFNKTLPGTGTIGIAGTFTPGTGAAHTITGSTINFNAAGSQNIPGFTYNNLTSSGGGVARILDAVNPIKIAGTFTPGTDIYTITGSTIEYNGTSAQVLPSAGFNTYNNLTLNNAAGTTGFAGLTVNGLLEIKAGTFTSSSTFTNVQIDSGATLAGTNGTTMNVSGNWTNNGGTFTPNGNTVNFNGGGAQSINGTAASQTFNNFTVNKSGGTLNTGGSTTSLTVNNFTLTAGSFTAPATLNISGNTVLTAGTFTSGTNIIATGNWTNNGATFTAGAGTVTFNGGAGQTIGGTTATVFNNLTNSDAGGISMTNDNTVNGVLALTSGDITVAATKTLTQPVGGSSSGTFDVNGRVQRNGFVSGGAALSFGNPFNTIQVTAGTAPANIVVDLARSVPTGAIAFSTAVQRTYTITPSASGFTGTLRLHYLDSELNGNNESTMIFRRFDNVPAPGWRPVAPTSRDTVANWLQATGVTAFSPWTMNSTSVPTAAPSKISGHIADATGRSVEGTTIYLSGGQTRKTITDAAGNYKFDNVEANGFYTVIPSRLNFTFTPVERSFSQIGDHTDAAFTAVSGGDSANPLDTAEYFVRQQYVDILAREPDEGGFNYWSDQILACGNDAACTRARRTAVAAAFFIEQEAQLTGSFIYDMYAGTLGRRPIYTEYFADRQQVVGGASLDAAKAAYAQSFVQRSEFITKYQGTLTAETFVDALLQSSSASGVDLSGERANLIGTYNLSTDLVSSRAAVVRSLADNAAFKQAEYNKAFVLTEYFAYLRRDIDQGGYDFWVNVLSNGDAGNYLGMVCSFVTSREYQERFSAVVSHSNGECGP